MSCKWRMKKKVTTKSTALIVSVSCHNLSTTNSFLQSPVASLKGLRRRIIIEDILVTPLGRWKKGEKELKKLFLAARVVEKERIECLLLYFISKAFLARLEWLLQLTKVFYLCVCNIWNEIWHSSTLEQAS